MYEFLLRYVVSNDTDAKTAKKYIDQVSPAPGMGPPPLTRRGARCPPGSWKAWQGPGMVRSWARQQVWARGGQLGWPARPVRAVQ